MSHGFLSASDFCFLLGAGASKPAKIPTMPELGEEFIATFSLPTLREFLEEIDTEFAKTDARWAAGDRNIENLLKVLQAKSESLRKQGLIPFSGGPIDLELTKKQVDARSSVIIAFELKKFILNKVARHRDIDYLAPLAGFLPKEGSLDIFSLNYDTIIEDFCSKAGVQLTDGFDHRGEWQPELFHQNRKGIRLWKLHGSATWAPSNSGWPRKTDVSGSWRRHLRTGHTASVTMETALVWPAAKEDMERTLLLLHSRFQRRLVECRLLIVAGYRFADYRIREAVLEALQRNNELRVVLICGPGGSEQAKESLLHDEPQFDDRVEIFDPSYFDAALEGGRLLNYVQHTISGVPATPATSRAPKKSRSIVETLCLGQFNAIAMLGNDLLLTRGNPHTALVRYDVRKDELVEICAWRGWARGLAVLNEKVAVIADCSRHGFKAGWGVAWTIDLETGTRRPLLPSSPLDFLRVILMTARYRFQVGEKPGFLNHGMLSWPTSVDVIPGGEHVIITEARRPVMIDSRLKQAIPLRPPEFFNLVAVRCHGAAQCLLLEHVLRYEGVLWNLNWETNELVPLLAGIHNATSLLVRHGTNEAFIAQGDAQSAGKIWRVDLAASTVEIAIDHLEQPGAMAVLDSESIAVATAEAVFKVRI